MKVVLAALATANPPRYATQEEAYQFLESQYRLEPQERDLYRRLLLEGPIRGRHIGVERDIEICSDNPDELTERFLKHGRIIATQAARTAIEQASLAPGDIEAVVVNTCTGYACPGLSSYVAQDLGLEHSVAVLDMVGMGCGAAIPNLECAAHMIEAAARKTVLSIAVEICSATFFRGPEPDLIVSNSIFGDGAGAAVLEGPTDCDSGGLLELVDFETLIVPEKREALRYRQQGGHLRNVLGRAVPVIGARAIAQATQRLLARQNLTRAQIDWWAVHPGGTAVLERVAKALELSHENLRFSYEVFEHYGNMSSPSVLFVLEKILREGQPRKGDKGLLLAFGAGFTAFAGLVSFR